MDLIKIGKIVSTHGIKGEVRILSDFPFKSKVFVVGNKLIIDNKPYEIKTYRVHKKFDMVTLDDYTDINEVLFLLKKDVYIDKNNLILDDDEVLDSDLISYKVFSNDGKEGIIKEIFMASPSNKVVRIMLDREYLIPYKIIKIDKNKKCVNVEIIDGM